MAPWMCGCFGCKKVRSPRNVPQWYAPPPAKEKAPLPKGYQGGYAYTSRAALGSLGMGGRNEFAKCVDGEQKAVHGATFGDESSGSGASGRLGSGWFHKGRVLNLVGAEARGASSGSTEPLIDSYSAEVEGNEVYEDYGDSGAAEETEGSPMDGWGHLSNACTGASKTGSQQSRFRIVDTQSSHTRRATRGGSRFVSLGTPSFDSSSSSYSSGSFSRCDAAVQDMMTQSFADLMSRGSTWTSANSLFTWGDSECAPVSRFVQIRGDPSSADSELSSDACPRVRSCEVNHAVELQDAISRALKERGKEESLNLGACILAALRDRKSSKGLPPHGDLHPTAQEGPKGTAGNAEDEPGDSLGPLSELLTGRQSEGMTWFNNPLQIDLGDESDRGKSLGASIILPVEQQQEEEALELANIVQHALSVDKNLLQQLERQSEQHGYRTPELLSSLSSISGPDVRGSTPDMPEAAKGLPLTEPKGAATQELPLPACEDVDATCGMDNCLADGCGEASGCEQGTISPEKQVRAISMLFNSVDGHNSEQQHGFHDSAITLGGCAGGSTNRSLVSQHSEEQGLTWDSSAASSSMCLLPCYPSLEAKTTPATLGAALGTDGDKVPSEKEADQESLDSTEFQDCLSDNMLEEAMGSPLAKPQRGDVQGGSPHTVAIPDLKLGKVVFGRFGHWDTAATLNPAAKHCLDPLGLTPRDLERWQQDLKLIWMGEDEDDLVAEVHRGMSCNMETARMAPLFEEDEAAWEEGASVTSPINSPVSSPTQTCFSDDCSVEDTARVCTRAYVMEDRTKSDLADAQESAQQHDGGMDAVGRALMELKNGSPRKSGPSMDHGMRPWGIHSCVWYDALAGSAHRKKSVLKSVKSQLQKLTQVVTCNGPLPLASGAMGDSASMAELEKAMLADVRRKVAALESEFRGDSSVGDGPDVDPAATRLQVDTMNKAAGPGG